VLRAPPEAREASEQEFFADLRKVGQYLARVGSRAAEDVAQERGARDREIPRAVTPAADRAAASRRPSTAGRARPRAERRPRGEA
jgi:hypothetical protein